jgi:cellulose biosynthesis protein BcsQ
MTKQGQILTFYSYKGGTGRSMLLANVACLLAERNSLVKVLIIDWDLEAPGLHRYFQDYLQNSFRTIKRNEEDFNKFPGLIDLFIVLEKYVSTNTITSSDEVELLLDMYFADYIIGTDIPSLFLLKAGLFDTEYGSRVSSFRWDNFYRACPNFFSTFANWLSKKYDYVLIDSRTGISDTSGICTRIMPEKLIAVFTPNRQSLTGLLELVERATEFRRNSEDTRPLITFPVPSRVENAELKLREDWRYGNEQQFIKGYQPEFEQLFERTYDLAKCNLQDYFDQVQIHHVPIYLYGEQIAVLSERDKNRLSLMNAYLSFNNWMAEHTTPWVNDTQGLLTQDSNLQWDVFLSFSSKDREFAKQISNALRSSGITVWSQLELNVGTDLHKEIEEAIRNSTTMVVLLSPDSTKSQWVQREIGLAIEFQRRIYPVLISGELKQAVPLVLQNRQLIDMRDSRPSKISRLTNEIRHFLANDKNKS